MPKTYRELPSRTLNRNISYCQPQDIRSKVTVSDAAKLVMTDFRRVKAITTQLGTSIADCNAQMMANNVRLLLVTDNQRNIHGIITAVDILGEKPILYMQKTGISRDEVEVKDIMTPTSELEALRYDDVINARVGDIVETLINCGRQHAIVTCGNEAADDVMICGMFSTTQIGKQLGAPIEPADIAKSFAELEKAIVA